MLEFFAAIMSGFLSFGNPGLGIEPQLCHAIMVVESGGNPNAVGDNGKAVGAYQIWPIMVADASRISGKKFVLSDRLSVTKSREMFIIYSTHYARHNNDWSPEGIARRWVGGPKGHLKSVTMGYWKKVRQEMK